MFSQLHHRLAGAATLVVLGATLALASPVAATETDTATCTDKAWANYNTCLVNNAAFEWAMRECDIAFEQAYASCYSVVVGFLAGLLK